MGLDTACSTYGCQNTVPCAQHTRPRIRRDHHALYSSANWRRFRQALLNTHPLCGRCKAKGFLTLAVDIHHRIALRDGGPAFDVANTEPLCKSCHSRETGSGR